ncbi:MAG: 16S rRNA (uracil1498-N3)-methyltransferase [Yoonia sp.]|jgi:16S rRNA (uracil1498-N3)-methyltransferase
MFAFMASKVRLFVDHPLGQAQSIPLTRDQAHYLFGVMRLAAGTVVSVINGADGEWDAQVVEAGKKNGVLLCQSQTKPLQMPPDVWLLFAPIRKERTAFIVEKATELGAARIMPIQTEYTNNADRLRVDKLRAHALEATEQCGGTYVPTVDDLAKLSKVLDGWDVTRQIMFCDETMLGQPSVLDAGLTGPWAIVIGPEGGFSDKERTRLRSMDCAYPVSLGPRILRADTAAVAALALWQNAMGDWA